jgi:hypothetical protein
MGHEETPRLPEAVRLLAEGVGAVAGMPESANVSVEVLGNDPMYGDIEVRPFNDDVLLISWSTLADGARVHISKYTFDWVTFGDVPVLIEKFLRDDVTHEKLRWPWRGDRLRVKVRDFEYVSD